MGFGVWGLGFGVWGLGFRVSGVSFRVWGVGFRVWGLGSGFRVKDKVFLLKKEDSKLGSPVTIFS